MTLLLPVAPNEVLLMMLWSSPVAVEEVFEPVRPRAAFPPVGGEGEKGPLPGAVEEEGLAGVGADVLVLLLFVAAAADVAVVVT